MAAARNTKAPIALSVNR